MNQRGNHKVLGIRHLTKDTFVLTVERCGFAFLAGQYVSLGLKDSSLLREYSLYSGEKDETLEFLVRKVDGGTLSPLLRELEPGAAVTICGPYSDFTLTQQLSKHVVLCCLLVATGTGIAPFHSFVRSYPWHRFSVFHGVRFENERYDYNDYSAHNYVACISKPELQQCKPLRVTSLLKEAVLTTYNSIFLCGNRAMILDAIEILAERGYPSDQVFSEVFF